MEIRIVPRRAGLALSLVALCGLLAAGCGSSKKKDGSFCQTSNECASGLCVNNVCITVSTNSDTSVSFDDAQIGRTDSGGSSDGPVCPGFATGYPEIDALGAQLNASLQGIFETLCQCTSSGGQISYQQCLDLIGWRSRCVVKEGQETCFKQVVDLDPAATKNFLQCLVNLQSTTQSCMEQATCVEDGSTYQACVSDETAIAACEAMLTEAQRAAIDACNAGG